MVKSEKQQQMRAPCSSKRADYHYKGVCSIMACHFISMCAHTNIHRVTRTVTIINSNTVEAGWCHSNSLWFLVKLASITYIARYLCWQKVLQYRKLRCKKKALTGMRHHLCSENWFTRTSTYLPCGRAKEVDRSLRIREFAPAPNCLIVLRTTYSMFPLTDINI